MPSLSQNVKAFLKSFMARIRAADLSRSSAVIAYFVLLSIFPLLVILVALLPYLPVEAAALSPYLSDFIPAPVMDMLMPAMENMLSTPNSGLLSLGILGTIWSASKGMKFLQEGIDDAYGLGNAAHFLASRILSVLTLILVIVLLLAILLLFSFGGRILAYYDLLPDGAPRLLLYINHLKWPVTFLMLFIALVVIYKSTPNASLKLGDVTPGALTGAICLMALVRLVALYMEFSTRTFLNAYGTLGGVFVLILWVRFAAYVLLLGAVFNAAVYEGRYGKLPQKSQGKIERLIRRGAESVHTRRSRR